MKEDLVKRGYTVLFQKRIEGAKKKAFSLPKGAKEIRYDIDAQYYRLLKGGYTVLPIKLSSSIGGTSIAMYGGSLTRNGENLDDIEFTISNISKLDRMVLICWK